MTSPGLSSVPASIEPIMTVSAPAATALAASPENFTPPSAMTGTPYLRATAETSAMAVSWGTPTPATTRVVQMEPGPMPTLTAEAPARMQASAASAVAMLPAMMRSSSWGNSALMAATALSTPLEWPWAVSTTTTSTPALTTAWTRSIWPGPTAAQQARRPSLSVTDRG